MRGKFQLFFPFVLGLSLFVVLLLVVQSPPTAAQVGGTLEPVAYLPLVLRPDGTPTATPTPITPHTNTHRAGGGLA